MMSGAADPSARKVALVTGGTSGIGRSCASALAEDGYTLAILARRIDPSSAIPGGCSRAFACDVRDRRGVDTVIGDVVRAFGRIDLLLNCAGVFQRVRPDDVEPRHMDDVIGTNLIGTINACLACVPHLLASRGSIINISSRLAHHPGIGDALYAASKGGVECFSKALAVELGVRGGVRVNVISPGLVETDLLHQLPGIDVERFIVDRRKHYPLGRIGVPRDVAGLVCFLASAEACWLTGAVIPLDGGASVYGAG